jgi:drug/metabolite transporter (DMT)-like permease
MFQIPGYAKFIIALLICDMISSTMIKSYHLSNYTEHWRFILAILVYVCVPIFLLLSLKYEGVGNMNFYWNVLSTVFVFIIAIYYFGERVTNSQFIGIILALFGVFLVIHNGSSEPY